MTANLDCRQACGPSSVPRRADPPPRPSRLKSEEPVDGLLPEDHGDITEYVVFGRNEPTLHRYHNPYRACGLVGDGILVFEAPRIRDRLAADMLIATIPTWLPDVCVSVNTGLLLPGVVAYVRCDEYAVEVYWLSVDLP